MTIQQQQTKGTPIITLKKKNNQCASINFIRTATINI
jgi:hypothetical protein